MKKRIFIIGQCTLHWGRMEFGNIGNFYIAKPMFEELRRVFPTEEIATTMQFSKQFCEGFNIETVPMELYYDFASQDNCKMAKEEYEAVLTGRAIESDYVKEVKRADLVIDFSGDIWGDNADFLGRERFLTGIYKDMTAQALKPTVMIAGSPGPFKLCKNEKLIKSAFEGFDMVTNREHISTRLLKEKGFNVSKVRDYACPSFLFNAAEENEVREQVKCSSLFDENEIKVGFILCGWNFEKGPFDLWPRADKEYAKFVSAIINMIEKYDVKVYLLSHSNGFEMPPKPFKLIHGRDFPIMQQLKRILNEKGYGEKVVLLEDVYTPEVTKGIISNFGMLISGRMHGAVAGISQGIPTVILDYGHEPKAHKLLGFAEIADVQEYIANPNDEKDIIHKIEMCFENRKVIQKKLEKHMCYVKENAREQFECLKGYIE